MEVKIRQYLEGVVIALRLIINGPTADRTEIISGDIGPGIIQMFVDRHRLRYDTCQHDRYTLLDRLFIDFIFSLNELLQVILWPEKLSSPD